MWIWVYLCKLVEIKWETLQAGRSWMVCIWIKWWMVGHDRVAAWVWLKLTTTSTPVLSCCRRRCCFSVYYQIPYLRRCLWNVYSYRTHSERFSLAKCLFQQCSVATSLLFLYDNGTKTSICNAQLSIYLSHVRIYSFISWIQLSNTHIVHSFIHSFIHYPPPS